jgi:hypothetical protein|nr:MAG TPA: hypothetical protein [Caudoviricetes sp.]
MRKVIATNDDKNLRFVQVVEEDTFGDDIRGQITSTYAKRQPFINERTYIRNPLCNRTFKASSSNSERIRGIPTNVD